MHGEKSTTTLFTMRIQRKNRDQIADRNGFFSIFVNINLQNL